MVQDYVMKVKGVTVVGSTVCVQDLLIKIGEK